MWVSYHSYGEVYRAGKRLSTPHPLPLFRYDTKGRGSRNESPAGTKVQPEGGAREGRGRGGGEQGRAVYLETVAGEDIRAPSRGRVLWSA